MAPKNMYALMLETKQFLNYMIKRAMVVIIMVIYIKIDSLGFFPVGSVSLMSLKGHGHFPIQGQREATEQFKGVPIMKRNQVNHCKVVKCEILVNMGK